MNERLNSIENRLSRLEEKIDQLADKPPAQPKAVEAPIELAKKPSTTQLMFGQKQVPNSKPSSSESASAHWLLPIIALICFVLAGIFMVRLAIESGWLTAERQWGLLALLGLTLTGLGRWLERIDKDYRSYLSAAGVIILYIAAFSSSLYFEIVPQSLSLIFTLAVSGVCMALFMYHRSELFPILTSVGTYISPLLLGSKSDLIFNASFFLLLAVVFSSISNYLRTRTLSLTAAYLGIGVFTLLHFQEIDPERIYLIIGVLIFQFLAFAFGVYRYSIQTKSALSKQMAIAYLPILLFFYGTTYYFVDRVSPELAPWISLGFAGFVYGLHRSARQQMQSVDSQDMVSAFIGVVLIHSGYLQILPEVAKPWLLPVILLLHFISKRKAEFPKVAPVIGAFIAGVGILEYFKICFHLIVTADLYAIFPALITFAVGIFYYLKASELIKDKTLLFLGLLHLLAILSFYRIAFDFGSLAVSLAWGLYSVAILVFGYQKKDPSLAKSALIILLISSMKALVYDATQAPSIVRIGSLLVTGAILYGAGLIFKNIQHWEKN